MRVAASVAPSRASRAAARCRVAALLVGVALLAGCSSVNMLTPYDKAVIVDASAVAPSGLELAGDAEAALAYAEDRRRAYFENLQWDSALRNGSGVVAAGLTGWALYTALKPTSDGVLPAGDKRRLAHLGEALATLTGLRFLLVKPEQEETYVETYRALTCFMVQTSPLLMTQRETLGRKPVESPHVAWSTSTVPALGAGTTLQGDVERLEADLLVLDGRMLRLRQLVALYDARVDGLVGPSAQVKLAEAALRERSRDARRALRYAGNAFREGGNLLDAARHAGQTIRSGVALIVAQNNVAVRSVQEATPDNLALLKAQYGVMTAVQGIGAVTEADQADVVVRDTQKASAHGARLETGDGEMTAARGVGADTGAIRSDLAGARGVRSVGAAFGPARMMPVVFAGDAPGAGDARGGAAAAVGDPAAAMCRSCVRAVGPRKKKAEPSPPPVATEAGLKAIRERIDAALKQLAAAAAQRKKDAEKKERAEALAALKSGIDRKAANRLACPTATSDPAALPVCPEGLAVETESLYAARRPVAQALLNYRERVRQVAATAACADLAPLRVSPSDWLRAKAGSTVEYIVSQRDAAGSPLAVLEGPAEEKTGAQLVSQTVPTTKLVKLQVKLGARMKTQRIRVVVTDARQIATQVLNISVEQARKTDDDDPETADADDDAQK